MATARAPRPARPEFELAAGIHEKRARQTKRARRQRRPKRASNLICILLPPPPYSAPSRPADAAAVGNFKAKVKYNGNLRSRRAGARPLPVRFLPQPAAPWRCANFHFQKALQAEKCPIEVSAAAFLPVSSFRWRSKLESNLIILPRAPRASPPKKNEPPERRPALARLSKRAAQVVKHARKC